MTTEENTHSQAHALKKYTHINASLHKYIPQVQNKWKEEIGGNIFALISSFTSVCVLKTNICLLVVLSMDVFSCLWVCVSVCMCAEQSGQQSRLLRRKGVSFTTGGGSGHSASHLSMDTHTHTHTQPEAAAQRCWCLQADRPDHSLPSQTHRELSGRVRWDEGGRQREELWGESRERTGW